MCVFGRVAYPQVFVPTCLVATFSLLGRFPSGVGTVKFLNISFQSALCRFFVKPCNCACVCQQSIWTRCQLLQLRLWSGSLFWYFFRLTLSNVPKIFSKVSYRTGLLVSFSCLHRLAVLSPVLKLLMTTYLLVPIHFICIFVAAVVSW